MIESLALPAALRAQLKREAKDAFPRECCGLIEGMREPLTPSLSKGIALHPAANVACEPDRFEIDPAAHFALLRRLRGTGRELIGCYHSHPNGRADPSPRDKEGAAEADFLWLIASLESAAAEPHIAGFVWTGTSFAEVQLHSLSPGIGGR